MSFQRPALTDIIDRIRGDLSGRILGSAKALRRSVIGVLAIVWGGAIYLVYGYLTWIAKQVIPDTAEDEFAIRWASIKGLTQIAAVFHRGTVSFAASSSGLTMLATTLMQANDGTQYSVDTDATSSGGFCVATVTCLTAGVIGQRSVSDTITLLTPIQGITSQGSWASTTQTGTDQETIAALQARMLLAFQTPPQGGAPADYVQWALQVAGVTRAWVFKDWLGAGSVGVAFVRDGDGTGAAIIPDAGEVATVQAYLVDLTRAPVTANVTAFAPTGVTQNFSIHLSPDTADLRAAVIASLTNLLYREAVPGGTMYLSHIRAAIREVLTGDYTMATPAVDQVFTNSQIGIMGTVTWT